MRGGYRGGERLPVLLVKDNTIYRKGSLIKRETKDEFRRDTS